MLNEKLSEFVGTVVGDGCLTRFWSSYDNRIIYLTSLTGSWQNDSKYYQNVIQPIIFKEFGVKGYIYHRKDESVRFSIKSKNVFDFLNGIGMPVGVKRRIRTPKEIFQNYMGPTVKGMIFTLITATLLEVCSEGTAPVAFEIFRQTGSLGNSLVFLMAGVATDYTEIGLLWTNIGKRTALMLPLVTVPQIIFWGIVANRIF